MMGILRNLGVLLAPCGALVLFYHLLDYTDYFGLALVLLHLLTAAWVITFFRRRFCRLSVLPVSFLASLAGPYLIETARGGFLQYLGTAFFAVLYAFPWAAVTLIAAAAVLWKEKRNTRSDNDVH